MNIQYLAAWLQSRQGCGWILTILGGFGACIGIFAIVSTIGEYGPTQPLEEWIKQILGFLLFFPILPIGILCLVIGIWLINRKEKTPPEEEEETPAEEEEGERKSNRIWGWILVIVGGLLLVLGIWVGIDTIPYYHSEFVCFTPLLVVGILLVIFGRRLILRAEK